MKENDKTVYQGFGKLLILMVKNNTDNLTLSFNFDKIKAKFNVVLVELEELKKKGE